MAYTTLVRPILEYASVSWDPPCLKHIKTLERIQRQAAILYTQNYSRDPGTATQLLKDLQCYLNNIHAVLCTNNYDFRQLDI